jgi:pantoate--beta-alanine ligase
LTALIHTKEQLAKLPTLGHRAVVMTMGALHDGHRELIRSARKHADQVVLTVFVNPLQFAPSEDLDRYPRSLERDVQLAETEAVDVVFAPNVEEVYPDGSPQIRVDPGPIGDVLEGKSRPGHFGGVLTVVLKLLNLTCPDIAAFGEKDYQQLVLVRRMVRDLDLPVRILAVPVVRDRDGLALSSRNAYLSPTERQAATALSRALRAGACETKAAEVLSTANAFIDAEPGVRLDYLSLTDPELGPAPIEGPARLLVAAHVGRTRLIDNMAVTLTRGGH